MPISEIVPESVIMKMVDEIARVIKAVKKHMGTTELVTKL